MSPAYERSGTTMHATAHGHPNSTTEALCGAAVIRSRGEFVRAATSGGPLITVCVGCLRDVVASLA